MAPAVAALTDRLPDAFDLLSPGKGAHGSAEMLMPLFLLLQRVVPAAIALAAAARPSTNDDGDGEWVEDAVGATLEAAWVAFEECEKKPSAFVRVAMELFLHPAFFCRESSSSNGPDALAARYYARLVENGRRSARLMSMLAVHCTRLWDAHRAVASFYEEELCELCCYTNSQEESSTQFHRNDTIIDMALETGCSYSDDAVTAAAEYPSVYPMSNSEQTVRVAARTLIRRLRSLQPAGPATAFGLLQRLLARAATGLFTSSNYADGSDVWKKKVVLWQVNECMIFGEASPLGPSRTVLP